MPAVIRSMQCSNKIFFGQDFDRGRRSEYTVYASATPLKSISCECNYGGQDGGEIQNLQEILRVLSDF